MKGQKHIKNRCFRGRDTRLTGVKKNVSQARQKILTCETPPRSKRNNDKAGIWMLLLEGL